MKKPYILIAVLLWSGTAFSEYPELTAIKQHSAKKLPSYADRLTAVDSKFEGVIGVGESLRKFTPTSNIADFTSRSKDYWRATMEMSSTDPSILLAKAYMYMMQGKISWGERYLFLASLSMDDRFKDELKTYSALQEKLTKRLVADMNKGIALHDQGEYDKALEVYDAVLKEYPECAWAWYEKGFVYLTMRTQEPEKDAGDEEPGKDAAPEKTDDKAKPSEADKAAEMYARCRQCDPFYWKAYQGNDQTVISKLLPVMKACSFLEGDASGIKGFQEFAQGCHDAGLYDFAAQAEWILALYDAGSSKNHLKAFLDDLDKLGLKEVDFFRKQFKLDD